MKLAWILNVVVMAGLFLGLAFGTRSAVQGAAKRLETGLTEEQAEQKPPVASLSEVGYCTEQLKGVLRRVLTSCGLIGGGRRGCQPGEVRNVAQINDEDFNALFKPLDKRAGIVLFDKAKEDLDDGAKALIEKQWVDRRGASYFFLVARASTDGSTELNRALSHKRANSAYFQIADRFKDPDLEKTVGLLWLGEEYAQLSKDFCTWTSSRPDQECTEEVLNRSVILSWIDCRL